MTSPSQAFTQDVRLYCGAMTQALSVRCKRRLKCRPRTRPGKTPIDHRRLPRHECARRINQGTSSNISLRHGEGLLITPTSTPYETMQPEHDRVYGPRRLALIPPSGPSSEWRFHLDILRARPGCERGGPRPPDLLRRSSPSWAWKSRRSTTHGRVRRRRHHSRARRTRPSARRNFRRTPCAALEGAGSPACWSTTA